MLGLKRNMKKFVEEYKMSARLYPPEQILCYTQDYLGAMASQDHETVNDCIVELCSLWKRKSKKIRPIDLNYLLIIGATKLTHTARAADKTEAVDAASTGSSDLGLFENMPIKRQQDIIIHTINFVLKSPDSELYTDRWHLMLRKTDVLLSSQKYKLALENIDALEKLQTPAAVKTYILSLKISAGMGLLESAELKIDPLRQKNEKSKIGTLIKQYSTMPGYDHLFEETLRTALISGQIRKIGLALSR